MASNHNLDAIQLTEEEKAEIAYIKYFKNLKSHLDDFKINIDYNDSEMITNINLSYQQTYKEWDDDNYYNFKTHSAFIQLNEQGQIQKLIYKNNHFGYEQFHEYHRNRLTKKELIVKQYSENQFSISKIEYFNTGKPKI